MRAFDNAIGNDKMCSSSGSRWTEWFNIDGPSDSGDHEVREKLIDKICLFPTALEGSVKNKLKNC